MANLATVVALLSLSAITRHMAVATTGVAGLTALTTTESATIATLVTTISAAATITTSSLRAVTSNMANLGALVALLTTSAATTSREAATTTSTTVSGWVSAITRDVTRLTALVAGLVLRTLRAFTAHVSFTTTVVALGWASSRAVTGLVRGIATVVAAAALGSTTVGIHSCGEGVLFFASKEVRKEQLHVKHSRKRAKKKKEPAKSLRFC